MFLRNCLFILAAATLVFAGCKKADEYPIEPAITFKSLTTLRDANGYDTEGILEIEFTDGDGDIGLNSSDTIPPYTGEYINNVHILCYYYMNGAWNRLSAYDDRSVIPVITPEGNQKAIRGVIRKDHIGLLINEPNFPYPVVNIPMRFDVYIYDRALHRSNVVTTSQIVVTTQ
jgi:hypothetical protein